ncbi:MAG: ABC transporter permease [Tepidisphaeraceae bacterium]
MSVATPTIADSVVVPPVVEQVTVRRRPGVFRRLVSKPLTALSLAVVLFYIAAGLGSFLPVMTDLINTPIGTSYQPPQFGTPGYWFGTDILGRSVFWRTIYGTRTALIITAGTGLLSLSIGTILGVCSGYFGGKVDAFVTWLFTTISSIPWILLVVAIAFALQGYTFSNGQLFKDRFGDLPAIILALGLTGWVGLCRLLRGETMKLRAVDYVQAARAIGASTPRILGVHILPNVTHLIIISFSLAAVGYVQAEVALTFIGIGINNQPSWGRMITEAKLEVLRGVWWQLAAATLAIFAISLALNVLGDALRDALDPEAARPGVAAAGVAGAVVAAAGVALGNEPTKRASWCSDTG